VPDYGNYGCGCSPFGCGYPLLPPIGVVVFGGGGGGVAAGGIYIPPTPIDYVVRSQAPSGQPDYTGYNLCVATCGTALLRCGLACLVNEELTPFGQALCGLTCTTFYGFCVHDCKKAFNIP